jgi:hypothetical protein
LAASPFHFYGTTEAIIALQNSTLLLAIDYQAASKETINCGDGGDMSSNCQNWSDWHFPSWF